MDFLLDPYVIAVPSSIATDKELSTYIDTLKRWLLASGMKKHNLWFTSYLTKTLNKENIFPYPSIIKSRYSRDLSHQHKQDLQSLAQVIQGRLMQPPHLDTHLNLPEPDLDLIDSVVLPEEIENRLSPYPDVAYALKKSLVAMGIASVKNNSDEVRNIFFATIPVGSASQVEIDINQLDESAVVECINASWPFLTNPNQLDEVEGLFNFWQDTQRALDWAYNILCAKNSLGDSPKRPVPIIGKGFNKSIEEAHHDKSLTVLDALFRNAVLALNGAGEFFKGSPKHHELRIGPQSNQPQRVRASDGATAWRVHLCSSIRLHYWLLPDEKTVEFSIVTKGEHNQFDIE